MTAGSTSNHGLIYPNADDPVPNWPSINDFNSDKLDSLLGHTSLQDYTPSLELSDTSNPGSETNILGKYMKIMDMYLFYFWVGFDGSGIDMGAGTVRVTLPTLAHPDYRRGNTGATIGSGFFWDSGSGLERTPIIVKLSSARDDAIYFPVSTHVGDGSEWNLKGDYPTTIQANDQVEGYGVYKAADEFI